MKYESKKGCSGVACIISTDILLAKTGHMTMPNSKREEESIILLYAQKEMETG